LTAEGNTDLLLHARLVAWDPTAPADLAVEHLGPLVSWLLTTFRTMDPHDLEEIAVDLMMSLAQRPEQFDPSKSGLDAYLRMAARGDLRNAIRNTKRRMRHEVAVDDVELVALAGNSQGAGEEAIDVLERRESERRVFELIRPSCTDVEWRVVCLIVAGERRTRVFAEVLGIADRDGAEQKREVKRAKDRLIKRIRRLPHWEEMGV